MNFVKERHISATGPQQVRTSCKAGGRGVEVVIYRAISPSGLAARPENECSQALFPCRLWVSTRAFSRLRLRSRPLASGSIRQGLLDQRSDKTQERLVLRAAPAVREKIPDFHL
jgi:hypothetical protein